MNDETDSHYADFCDRARRGQDISSSSSEGSDEEVQPPTRNLGLWKPPKQEENKLDGSGAARVDYSSPSLIPRRILEKKQEATGASSRARGAAEDNKEEDSMFRGAMSGMQANSSRLLVDLARTPEGVRVLCLISHNYSNYKICFFCFFFGMKFGPVE